MSLFSFVMGVAAEEQLRLDPMVGPALNNVARQALINVRNDGKLPGQKRLQYRKRSVRIMLARPRSIGGELTQAALLMSYDNLAVIFEFGTKYGSPKYRPLTDAITKMASDGVRFVDTGEPGVDRVVNESGFAFDNVGPPGP